MSNINKSIVIAVIATLIVGAPVVLIDLQLTNVQLLIALFLVSLASAMSAAQQGQKTRRSNSKKPSPPPARSSYNKAQRESGSVKWFNASKGFGFITRDSGDDIFVHFRSIRGEGHRVLHDGQRVEFAISEGDKGLQAEDVAAAGK